MSLIIIKPRPGLTTTQQILQLIEDRPQGVTVRELSEQLNRPVSMVNLCLKILLNNKQVVVHKSLSSQKFVYYSVSKKPFNLTING